VSNAVYSLVEQGVFLRDSRGLYRLKPDFVLPGEGPFTQNPPEPIEDYLISLKKAVDDGRAKFEFHDINLMFTAPQIYAALESGMVPSGWRLDWRWDDHRKTYVGNKKFISNAYRINRFRTVKFSVGPQDTVEVFVASTEQPFEFSDRGILDLHAALVEGRTLIWGVAGGKSEIPDAKDWTVLQWQRHVDSPDEASGPRVNVRFQAFGEVVGRFYVKLFESGEFRARAESIEPVGKSVADLHEALLESPFLAPKVEKLTTTVESMNKVLTGRLQALQTEVVEASGTIGKNASDVMRITDSMEKLVSTVQGFVDGVGKQVEQIDVREMALERIASDLVADRERLTEILQRMTAKKKGIFRRLRDALW
jgi:hypothetical protein